MKNIFVILMSVLLYSACYRSAIADLDGIEEVKIVDYNGRYVSRYGSPSKLELRGINLDSVFLIRGFNEFDILYNEQKQDSIAKIFNDLNYKALLVSKFTLAGVMNHTCFVSTDSISSIEIISDKDFDATHPAGTNLSDLFHFRGFSVEKFIKSNYDTNISELKVLYDWFEKDRGDKILMVPDRYLTAMYNGPGEGKSYLYPITLRADEVNFNNSKLLGEYLTLYTRVKPLVKGEHNIVVKFRFSNKELSKSLVADFDKVETNNKIIFYQSHSMKYGRNLSFLLK